MKDRFDFVFKWVLRLLALLVAIFIIFASFHEWGWTETAVIRLSYYLIPLVVGVLIRWKTTGKHLN